MGYEYGAPTSAASDSPEDDWFGEGNAFESGEELAAALLALAQRSEEPQGATPDASAAPPAPAGQRESFLLLDPRALLAPEEPQESAPAPPAAAPVTTRSWSVRTPGAIPLPPRAPGRSGWTIRNSVQLLQRTEEIINGLRHEALLSALNASFRALHPDGAAQASTPQAV